MSEEIAAGGVPEGSTGTGTEPGEIAPPAVFDDVDPLAELVARIPSEGQVMILLRMLERVGDERDALQARIDAYEGHLERWEEMDRLIAASSLGGEEAQRIRDRVPPEVGKAIVRAVQEAERADRAEDERDRLRASSPEVMARDVDVVDLMNAEYGCPDCGVHHACGEIVAERDRLRAIVEGERELRVRLAGARCARDEAIDERDRLRAVVDAAMLLWYATYPTGKPRPELIAARNDFEQAVAQLDVSPTMGEGEGR